MPAVLLWVRQTPHGEGQASVAGLRGLPTSLLPSQG